MMNEGWNWDLKSVVCLLRPLLHPDRKSFLTSGPQTKMGLDQRTLDPHHRWCIMKRI